MKRIRSRLVIDVESEVYTKYTSDSLADFIREELEDNDYIVHSIDELKPKRSPDANGVLPLTKSELKTFENLVDEENIEAVILENDGLEIRIKNEECKLAVYEVKAILWLAERFELEG